MRASQMASAAPATIRRLLSLRARLVLAATCDMVDRLSPLGSICRSAIWEMCTEQYGRHGTVTSVAGVLAAS